MLGDLHGNRRVLLEALTDLGLADEAGHWIGGRRRLVQLGDMIDRGPEPLDTLDLLMRLQDEARAAGGEVVCLLGNHELMALRAGAGDHESGIGWVYNGAGADLAQWAARRGEAFDETVLPYPAEFLAEFGPAGHYGRWLRTLPVACRAGDYVVVHAGWTPEGPDSVDAANTLLRAAPVDPAGYLAATGPVHWLLWARKQPDAEIAAACSRLGCKGLIAGHTVQPGIRVSAGGQLVQIDVGMFFFGTWAAVGLAKDGGLWALVRGEAPVPLAGDGLVPVPQPTPDAGEGAAAPRFGPGDLVRVYRAPDGSYAEYMQIQGFAAMAGAPAYTGRMFTFAGSAWAARPSAHFCERVDRFGRPARLDEVPADLLE